MKTIVIKIGSSILMTRRNKLDEFRIDHIANQVLSLREQNIGVLLVVSGAVASGSETISCLSDNQELKKLAAGMGQVYLISVFQHIFSKKRLQIAQILLTKHELYSMKNHCSIARLLKSYIKLGIIPIVNENDVVDLNSFGGNDILAAHIALLLQKTQLLILSTMTGSTYGVGGGETKQQALRMLSKKRIRATIVDGKLQNIILQNIV